MYFFSLDAANPLAVLFARSIFHLPYFWAQMKVEPRGEREISFYSRRLISRKPVKFVARYRGLGPTFKTAQSRPGSIEYFLTERYCLFTHDALGRLHRANIHHLPWPLEQAEAEFEHNDLPAQVGLTLPDTKPLLHYARHLAVYVWPTELVQAAALEVGPVVASA